MDAGMWRMWREEIEESLERLLSYTCAHLAAVQMASIMDDYGCKKEISKEMLFVRFIQIVCFGSLLPNENTASVGRWRDSLTNCHCTKVYKRKKTKATSCTDRQKIQQPERLQYRLCWNTVSCRDTTITLNHRTDTLLLSTYLLYILWKHWTQYLVQVAASPCFQLKIPGVENHFQWWKKCSDPQEQRKHHYNQSMIWGRMSCDQNDSNFLRFHIKMVCVQLCDDASSSWSKRVRKSLFSLRRRRSEGTLDPSVHLKH